MRNDKHTVCPACSHEFDPGQDWTPVQIRRKARDDRPFLDIAVRRVGLFQVEIVLVRLDTKLVLGQSELFFLPETYVALDAEPTDKLYLCGPIEVCYINGDIGKEWDVTGDPILIDTHPCSSSDISNRINRLVEMANQELQKQKDAKIGGRFNKRSKRNGC